MGQGLGERGGGFKKCAGFFLFVGVLYYYVSTTISTMYRSTRPVYLILEGAAGVWWSATDSMLAARPWMSSLQKRVCCSSVASSGFQCPDWVCGEA